MSTRCLLKGSLVVLISLAAAGPVHSQEMWGVSGSNMAGQMGVELNPASIVAAPYRWELHLVSADFSLMNNFYLLKRQSGWVRNALQGQDAEKGSFGDRYREKPQKFIYSSDFLKYPSFIWSGRRTAIGFNFSTRLEWSVSNLPWHLAKYLKEGLDYDPQQGRDFKGDDIRFGLLAWHSAGISVARVVANSPVSFVTAGVTVNYNYCFGGAYAYIDDLRYNVPADTLLVVDQLNGEYGYAYSTAEQEGGLPFMRNSASGFSFTGGLQYFRNRRESWFEPCNSRAGGRLFGFSQDKPYDFRLGFSVLDLGYFRFGQNARVFSFDDKSTYWYGIDTVKFSSIAFTDSSLSQQFNSSSVPKPSASAFTLLLPAAVSIQLDVPVNSMIFLNLSCIQRLAFSRYSLTRANQLAFIPRFETRRVEFALPLSFYEFFRPRLGFSVRYGILTLGSDMPGAFIGLTDTYGTDLYFGLSWKGRGRCDGRKPNNGRRPSIERCVIPR